MQNKSLLQSAKSLLSGIIRSRLHEGLTHGSEALRSRAATGIYGCSNILSSPRRSVCEVAANGAPTDLLRNFAIIAHVDHGKTTLMDTLLHHDQPTQKEDKVERVLDSGAFEKERGITITSKYTSFRYKEFCLNAVDTPGHADFGGEVERILGMVDGCVLLVDVTEGPMPQTKFVLSKALAMGLHPLVVFNKVDRPTVSATQCDLVHGHLFDLFSSLGATESQLDFPVLFASGKEGWASEEYTKAGNKDMTPLLDAIVRHVPPPRVQPTAPFSMLVTMIEHDSYLGRTATGRVASGAVGEGSPIKSICFEPKPEEFGKVTRIVKRQGGFGSQQLSHAHAGDIITITGISNPAIGDTICAPEVSEALQPGQIDPPTLSMVFAPNSSPVGRAPGNEVTAQKLLERLHAEALQSVSLRVFKTRGILGEENIEVHTRGELQLSLLIEGMRRERFEMEISAPQVLLKREGGHFLEPLEEVWLDVPEFSVGSVVSTLQARKGMLQDMHEAAGRCKMMFHVPTRGLIGYKRIFTAITKGEGLINRAFLEFTRHQGPMDQVRKGVLISMAEGNVTSYAMNDLQARGTLFVSSGEVVYSGMIVGESSTDDDLHVNPTRCKKLTNVRSKQADEKFVIQPPRLLTLEDCIGYVQPDELIEVTPDAIRLRKMALNAQERKKAHSRLQMSPAIQIQAVPAMAA